MPSWSPSAPGRRPILLLDEIAAHLDPLRRAALFERLAGAGGQVWMTGTEPSLFAGIPAESTRLTVAGGAVKAGLNSGRFPLGFGPRFPI